MNGFTIKVLGDITDLRKALAEAKGDLSKFGTQIDMKGGAASVDILTNELEQMQVVFRELRTSVEQLVKLFERLSKINIPKGKIPSIPPVPREVPESFNKTAGASQRATATLIDFSRIANDVPYGIIGIANNLSPAIEGFGRLKKEAGSTGGALKELGKSLIGPAGIGLALNLITSAFIIAQNGIGGFNRKTKEGHDKAKDFIDSLKEVGAVAEESAAGEQGNIAKIEALGAAVINQANSYEIRKRALQELKQINTEYFGDLSLEASKWGEITKAIDEYTKSLKAQAVLKGFTDEIGRVSVEAAKQERVLQKLQDALDKTKQKLNATPRFDDLPTGGFAGGTGGQISASFVQAQRAVEAAQKAFDTQAGIVHTLQENYGDLNLQIDEAVKKTLEFKDATTTKAKKGEDTLKKQLEYYERILSTINDVNEKVEVGEKVLDLKVRLLLRDAGKQGLTGAEIAATVRGFRDDFQKILEEQAGSLEFSPKLRMSQVIKVEIPSNVNFFATNTGGVDSKFNDEVSKAVGLDKKIPTITIYEANVKLLGSKIAVEVAEAEKLQKSLTDAINSAVLDIKVEAFAGIGDLLAGALTGGVDGLKAAAKNMLSTIGGVIGQLGKYIIVTALKIKALKTVVEKWAIANPALAIAAGVGMVALGSLLKNVSFGGPKLAEGGITTGPTIAQIGEAGREAIIPLNKLPYLIGRANNGTSGGAGSIGLAIRGRELVAFMMNEMRQFNRNF